MAGRRVRTIVGALVFGAMVGFRDATGLAPPPPVLTTEVVEWLSPEPEDDLDLAVVFVDPEPSVAGDLTTGPVAEGHGFVGRALRALRSVFRRGT